MCCKRLPSNLPKCIFRIFVWGNIMPTYIPGNFLFVVYLLCLWPVWCISLEGQAMFMDILWTRTCATGWFYDFEFVVQWPSFWYQFTVTVHDTDLPVVSTFAYLMSLLEGEPKQAMHGISLTTDHYAIACKIEGHVWSERDNHFHSHSKNICIFPYHPNALFQLYRNLMMNYRHTLDHLKPSA